MQICRIETTASLAIWSPSCCTIDAADSNVQMSAEVGDGWQMLFVCHLMACWSMLYKPAEAALKIAANACLLGPVPTNPELKQPTRAQWNASARVVSCGLATCLLAFTGGERDSPTLLKFTAMGILSVVVGIAKVYGKH